MKKFLFAIIVFSFCLLSSQNSWCASGRRHYDLQRSEALIKCGEALVNSGGKPLSREVMNELTPALAVIPQSESLVALLNERTELHRIYERAAELLSKGKYNELSALIDEAEESGKATAYLLQLRGLPLAFQALSLYCARRPYDNAEDQERALSMLAPYQESLSASPAFVAFLRQEQDNLMRLRVNEWSARVNSQLKQLDWALATAGREHECSEILREMLGMKTQSGLLRLVTGTQSCRASALLNACLEVSENEELSMPEGVSTEEFELALALTWERLTKAQRHHAERWLLRSETHPVTLTALAMQAGMRGSQEQFVVALKNWRQRASARELRMDAPAFLPAMLQLASGSTRPSEMQRVRWRVVAPGVPEILSSLHDLEPSR